MTDPTEDWGVQSPAGDAPSSAGSQTLARRWAREAIDGGDYEYVDLYRRDGGNWVFVERVRPGGHR